MKRTTCYTYFSITGEFDPDEITSILGIQPVKTFRSGEPRYYLKNGLKVDTGYKYSCSCWDGCRCEEYDVNISNQMEKTIEPRISPSMKVIDFCSKVRAELDIDWYIDNI